MITPRKTPPVCLAPLLAILLFFVPVVSGDTPEAELGAAQFPTPDPQARYHPVMGVGDMVVTQEEHATRAALQVLQEGGNAIDAAVTAGFALCVTLPRGAGLGGGGFMIVHMAEEGHSVAIDYRESAPAAAHRDLYLDDAGNADSDLSLHSPLASGVPGTVMGFAHALETYGTISLQRALEPAIALARDGFVVSGDLARSLRDAEEQIRRSPAAREIFLGEGDAFPQPGDILRQVDLAETLERIARHGVDDFYHGETARLLIADMEATGGIMTLADLADYQVMEREPARGTYRGYEIISMPAPSSGGALLVLMLQVLEHFPIAESGHNAAETIRILAETMKRAYADRAEHFGDPDFTEMPMDWLLSAEYAAAIHDVVAEGEVTPSEQVRAGSPDDQKSGGETTHFSVVDRWGNAVANTFSLNINYGRGHVAPGSGVIWNNTLDDFAAKPGVPNVYGLMGNEANAVAGRKRPLSSMSPTIVLGDDGVRLITGSPGGSRIITTTLQVILNVIDHGMNIQEAVNAPRMHHQWLPDVLELEQGVSPDTIRLLETMGYTVESGANSMGASQSITREGTQVFGAADPRRIGALAEGN